MKNGDAPLPLLRGDFGLHGKAGIWYATGKYNFAQRNVDMKRNLFVCMAALGIAGGLALSARGTTYTLATSTTPFPSGLQSNLPKPWCVFLTNGGKTLKMHYQAATMVLVK